MNNIINIKYLSKILILIGLATWLTGCDIEEIPNPNGPDLDQIVNNASRGDLNAVVSGIEVLMADDIDFYYDVVGIVGREYYFFTSADTRFTGELLGKGMQVLDNAGFYGTRPYEGRYKVVKNSNILLAAVPNNAANLALTVEEENGYIGFAQASQAYALQLALMLQYQNGIRVDVANPDALGPFVSFDEGLSFIRNLLDQSISNLNNAGTTFPFVLSSGYAGFDTPETYVQYVNGIAARIAIYQNDKAAALQYLNNSFLDETGDLNTGPERFFSSAGGEQINELFRTLDESEALIAHPLFVSSIQANPNDARNSKIALRSAEASSDGLSGEYDVNVYTSIEANVPLIRNEELILLLAEANIGTNNTAALDAINNIRTRNGVDAVSLSTDAELIDELLQQRWFSLYFEGHRWADMRRYNRLDQLPIDRVDDDVWIQMPKPESEN